MVLKIIIMEVDKEMLKIILLDEEDDDELLWHLVYSNLYNPYFQDYKLGGVYWLHVQPISRLAPW